MKVLIADDSLVIRNSLIKLISAYKGCTDITESINVLDTIRRIKEVKPDILILDIIMPGGNGLDVMGTVKKQDHKITVIVLTNFPSDYNRRRSIEEGVDYFLDKSNDFEKVVDIIDNFGINVSSN